MTDLIERYVNAVGRYLPEEQRQDVMAELRANLLEEIDSREEAKGGPLTDAEVAAVLLHHGKPEVVALRYLPQRSLIGPSVYPFYVFTLRRTAPLVVAIYLGAQALALFSGTVDIELSTLITKVVLGLVPTMLIFCGVMTIVFAAIEYAHSRNAFGKKWNEWTPAKLPPVRQYVNGTKPRSMARRIIDLVVHVLWMAYVLAVPMHPYLLLGPGAQYLHNAPMSMAPVWHIFFSLLIGLFSFQLAIKIPALFGPHRWEMQIGWVVKLLGLTILILMACTSVYFVPTSAAVESVKSVASVNRIIHLAFVVVLAIDFVKLVREVLISIRHRAPRYRLAV